MAKARRRKPAEPARAPAPSASASAALPARLPLVLGVVLALVAAGLYLPTLRAGFVYDDVAQLVIDDWVHRPGHLTDVLTLRVLGADVLDRNRPLVLLSLLVDSALWGRRPAGYHLTNVLLHAGCTVLLFALLVALRRRAPAGGADAAARGLGGAVLGALLFAVHPAASEAVAAITFREDLLATFFLLAGMLLAVRFPGAERRSALALGSGAAVAFFLAVAAKETGAAGPPLLLVVWWLFARPADAAAWRGLLAAVWALVGGFLVLSLVLAPVDSAILPPPEALAASLGERLGIAFRIAVFYLGRIVWPLDLCADYAGYPLDAVSAGRALVALAAALLPFVLALVDPVACLGVALFWLPLLPVSNLVPIYNPVADRYLYAPLAGCGLVAGACGAWLPWWRPPWRRALAGGAALALAASLAVVTLGRERVWHDGRALWADTLARNPASITAAGGLALALHDVGDPAAAIELWQRAIAMTESRGLEFARPWAGLALSFEAVGRASDADRAYARAVAIDERYREPRALVRALLWRPEAAEALAVLAARGQARQTSPR